jgi:protein YibB
MIPIVTAFFDIGRGTWPNGGGRYGTADSLRLNVPTSEYIERFTYLCKLQNDIVIYTSSDLAPRIKAICDASIGKRTIIEVDFHNDFAVNRQQIQQVMDAPTFKDKINPLKLFKPEYWSADYVLVTMLKAHFVADAVSKNLVQGDNIAWIDFGYCRSEKTINGLTSWNHAFDPTKIHMFNCLDVKAEATLDEAEAHVLEMAANDYVAIFGAAVIAPADKWTVLELDMIQSLGWLMSNGLVDDDQSLWLNAYYRHQEDFELHKISFIRPFRLFIDFD